MIIIILIAGMSWIINSGQGMLPMAGVRTGLGFAAEQPAQYFQVFFFRLFSQNYWYGRRPNCTFFPFSHFFFSFNILGFEAAAATKLLNILWRNFSPSFLLFLWFPQVAQFSNGESHTKQSDLHQKWEDNLFPPKKTLKKHQNILLFPLPSSSSGVNFLAPNWRKNLHNEENFVHKRYCTTNHRAETKAIGIHFTNCQNRFDKLCV